MAVGAEPKRRAEAEALARRLGLPLAEDAPQAPLRLVLAGERLELREAGAPTGPVYADLAEARPPAQPRREPLLRAVGLKGERRPFVVDATAGLGRDAFSLAWAGCRVTMLERSAVVAALLEDALARARRDPALREVAERLELRAGDALELLPQLPPPEVVYLDPMYPERGKRAEKRKAMRLFRALVGDDPDAAALLEAALAVVRGRVVLKRPLKGSPLAGRKPQASLSATTVRFDLYLPPSPLS